MSGLKLDSATIGSLNTCTLYPPCSNPFPKVKVISGSSSTINVFLGAKQTSKIFYYSIISPFSFLFDNKLFTNPDRAIDSSLKTVNKYSSWYFGCMRSIMIEDVPSLVGG